MPKLSFMKALNRALKDELERDPAVCVFGEDVGAGVTGLTLNLLEKYGAERIVDMPLSEQAFTSFAMGAALMGRRPVVEYQIPSLLFLSLEQIANQAHKFSLMTGGQGCVPVVYVVPGSGSRYGWAGQHSDHPYSVFAHIGLKTVVPAMPSDAYGLLVSAIREDDPVVFFAPAYALSVRENVTYPLEPVPLGRAKIQREGTDVTVVAAGHLVHSALRVAAALAESVSVEVLDLRTVYPLDCEALHGSVRKTRRLVVADDSNRTCGLGAEVIATVVEEVSLVSPPRRVTRPDGAVLPFAIELDQALQPSEGQLRAAIARVMKDA
jgi:pyruvate dehydrogenase E1 component beta subunit